MAPSLLMPSKGMFGNLFSVLWFCLNGFRTKVPISNYIWPMNWIELNWIFKCRAIAEICFLRTAILHCTWTWIIAVGNTWVLWISNILSIFRVGSYEYLVKFCAVPAVLYMYDHIKHAIQLVQHKIYCRGSCSGSFE